MMLAFGTLKRLHLLMALPCKQQGFNPFFPYGGFALPQPMQQAMMQQQQQQAAAAAAAMFGGGQSERMYAPAGMDPAMAMRSMQYAQAVAANAAMMGFQVPSTAASSRDHGTDIPFSRRHFCHGRYQ